ncbi:phosphatidate cytidylyltransferase, mitochondrial-like [Pecten maximus]|uniref:phosphatidate cytidylyltransferase, mitochondrial-like n=1 Tax=Pecten maximus TaxID=6579 RepID=UPI001458F5AE|nr:phosphatidate cytidylyltransferase, mitochondrial-like [Pecten maximus]XP_033734379.1 phosphatidate cytidylyltransferase, mitochondrial-like [Pecten maximus]
MAKFIYPKFGPANSIYQRVLNNFPSGMQMAFAYGSGVFKQKGQNDTKQNMMDFIFVVDDPLTWHRHNLKQNADHYSFLKRYGPNIISAFQESSAGLYFNPMVPFEDRLIKYGVISNRAMARDLINWRHLYISGRLHKPVMMVKSPEDPAANEALKINLRSAVHTSLILLPDKFSEVELFTQIASLSYTGDIRMSFGEDQNKVDNIVNASLNNFRILYKPILADTGYLSWDEKRKCFEQEYSYPARRYHLDYVPENVLRKITRRDVETIDDMRNALAKDTQCNIVLQESLQQIVNRSSKTQSFKGIFTGGLSRSSKYGASKVQKWFNSRKN